MVPGLKLTESGLWGYQFVHNAANDLLKIKHQNSQGVMDTDNIMTWTPAGKVGIGTGSPFSPLHVSGSNTVGWPNDSRVYLDDYQTNGILLQSNPWAASGVTTALFTGGTVVASHAVKVGSGTYTSSDRRMKNNIVDADDVECLDVLRQLKPKKYTYKDT